MNIFSKIIEGFKIPSPPVPEKDISPELMQKIRSIQIKTGHMVTDLMAGEYVSAFKGRGMEFNAVREYAPGDDIRLIDWNVTARIGQPFIKEFKEERELTVMLIVDVSSSGEFGSAGKFKNEVSAEVASILAFAAIRNNDKIGLIVFSDKIEHYIPPKKGKSHVLRIIRELLEFQPKSKKTDLSEAIKFLSNVMKKKAIVFVLSDFMTDDYDQTMKIAANKHDITGIRIFDSREEEIPSLGMIQVEDEESGELLLVNTSSKKVRRNYHAYYQGRVNYFHETFKRSGAGVIDVRTDQSYVKKLLGYFKRRG